MSMPENTCPTPKPDEILCTLSITSPDGSGHYSFPISLPAHAANILLGGLPPQRVAIWKHYGQLSATGIGSMVPLLLYPPSYCPPNPNRGTDG
jgi:hypothetical protein